MTKTMYVAFIFAALGMTSCGEQEKPLLETNKTNKNKVDRIDCDCSQIYWEQGQYKRNGELFSGTCESRNAQDNLIKLEKYNNGYPIHIKGWVEVDREMIQTKDLKYYNGNKDEGFVIKLKTIDKLDPAITYTSDYKEYKKGREEFNWFIHQSDIIYKSYLVEVNNDSEKEGCIMDGYINFSDSKEQVLKFLACVDQKKLPRFFYNGK